MSKSAIRLSIPFIFLVLLGCSKGKDCSQLYHHVISFENRTNRALTLDFVDSNNEIYTVEMKALEKADSKVVKEYYQTHEGGWQKGGAPSDGQCTSEPWLLAVSSFLAEKSFGAVKNCWDNLNFKSIFVEPAEACPADTYEQIREGRP